MHLLIHYDIEADLVILIILRIPEECFTVKQWRTQLKSRTVNACGPGKLKAALKFYEVRWKLEANFMSRNVT
jgi:hypothetical protein